MSDINIKLIKDRWDASNKDIIPHGVISTQFARNDIFDLLDYIRDIEQQHEIASQKMQEDLFNEFWELLNGIMTTMEDTIWFNHGTTAHERLIEIADKYDSGIGDLLEKRIES